MTSRSRRITVHPPDESDHPHVVQNGTATHVIITVEEYDRLVLVDMSRQVVQQIESSHDDDYVDADQFRLKQAAERIARARKAAGLTQVQLGRKLKIPQSQISRIERNPDHTTVRTLRRIARALNVDVRALV